tara:strand:- start:827 stop:1201 length:375 start_codon:yes stop_codon:yes gene_type:complete
MNKIFSELYKDLQSATYVNGDPLKNFLFQSKQSVLILFYIASQKDQKSTLEVICYNISNKIISRSTIQNILKEGVKVNFLEKEVNEKDKREKYYKFTKQGKKILQEWVEGQKKVFSNLNELNFE